MLLFIIAVRWVCRQSNHINANTTDNCYPNFLSNSSRGELFHSRARAGSARGGTRWHHWAEFLLAPLLPRPGCCSINCPILSSLSECTYALRSWWHEGPCDTLACRWMSIKCWNKRSVFPQSATYRASCLKSDICLYLVWIKGNILCVCVRLCVSSLPW